MESNTIILLHCIPVFFLSYLQIYADVSQYQKRDKTKQLICIQHGITLLIIPYWWDGKIESVAQMIFPTRPDVVIPNLFLRGDVIPAEMPHKRRERTMVIMAMLNRAVDLPMSSTKD